MMICGLLFGMVAFAQAQQGGGRQGGGPGGPGGRMGGMNPEARVKQLDEKLKLSDDQKTKLTAIFTEQAEAMKKAREEGQAGGGREAMMKMREENEKKVNAVLTADQQKAYKAWQEEQRAEIEKRMKERQEKRQGGN